MVGETRDVTFIIGFTAGGAVVIAIITLITRNYLKKRNGKHDQEER